VIEKFRELDDLDLQIQCDVFYDEKHNDDEELTAEAGCLDLNSHSDLFTAIYDRVSTNFLTLFVVFISHLHPTALCSTGDCDTKNHSQRFQCMRLAQCAAVGVYK